VHDGKKSVLHYAPTACTTFSLLTSMPANWKLQARLGTPKISCSTVDRKSVTRHEQVYIPISPLSLIFQSCWPWWCLGKRLASKWLVSSQTLSCLRTKGTKTETRRRCLRSSPRSTDISHQHWGSVSTRTRCSYQSGPEMTGSNRTCRLNVHHLSRQHETKLRPCQ
jgi:hypothetical protein